MRRLFAILLMLFVPIQFAWSAVQSVHGHLGHDELAAGFHYHDDHHHEHHHDADGDDHDDAEAGSPPQAHNDDGHHDGHFHHVFSLIVVEPQPDLTEALPHAPPTRPPASFTSHIPSPFDRPPLALA